MTPITLNVFEMFKYFEQYQKNCTRDAPILNIWADINKQKLQFCI